MPTARHRRPGTLRRSLFALVLVPVAGLVGFMGHAVDQQATRARAAATAAEDVRSAVALDAVRAAVAREVVPVLGRAVLQDPRAASSVGVDPGALSPLSAAAAPALAAQRHAVQLGTDAAVAAAAGTGAQDRARAAERRVRELRASTADGDLVAVFTGYREVASDLAAQVGQLLRSARAAGLDEAGTGALTDLQLVSRASALASAEVPLLFAAARPQAGEPDREAFLTAWGGYRGAAAEVEAQGSPHVVRAWREATSSAGAVAVDGPLRAAALDGQPPSLAAFVGLAAANGTRDAALRVVVETTGTLATDTARAPVVRAERTLRLLVALCALLVLGTLAAALLLRRWIAAPLDRLAAQARAVSDGVLVDVDESGPLEVRTVARGLAVAVDTLRRVRDQAQAVADGALDADVVHRPVRGALGEVVHASVQQMVGALHERERLQEVLAHQATHDALTGLPNRARAGELIVAALDRATRRGDDPPARVGLLFVDLDHFKAVNDTHGHAAGDQLLRVVGDRMSACLHEGPHGGPHEGAALARLGGDEFVVIVEGVRGEAGLVDLATRLLDAVCAPVELAGPTPGAQVRVGASIGVAISPPGGCPAERLLLEADAAAYRAKAAGRGTVVVFDDALRRDIAHRTALEEALRAGLDAGELVLHYQPVVDLTSSAVTGVEALVRWQRPGHGLVGPDHFVAVAEDSDLVCDLGRWALLTATAQLAAWDAEGGALAGVGAAVNVSGRHLAQPRLLGDVAVACAGAGLAPERLTLEITETVLVDEPTAREHLRALRALGVKVALDDFGTGYTSIGQLSRLPVDVLKIDRSFIGSGDRAHADLVRLVVGAAHSFSLGVVAEGVERDEQLQALRAVGCDAAQGFLLGRPRPAPTLGAELSALAAAAPER
ncbi:putative bifunctional diguanylate cyclase/phosphodiesterase [Kineococcus sp. SYSU DK002]|uniref:putative bifunctional diguanylate cyclase/phosphodiesterase n=1 Tax=Kineococcus sp. SYSU DK002 TaxID=3383123 RepID=UPI003D7EBD34